MKSSCPSSRFQFPQIPYPVLFVAAFALLLFLPESTRSQLSHLFNPPSKLEELQRRELHSAKELDAFSPEIATLDNELKQHTTQKRAAYVRALLPYVAARRIAELKRVSEPELKEVSELYADFQLRIANETLEDSKEAVRELRNKQIATKLHRIELKEVTPILSKLDDDYKATSQKLAKEESKPGQAITKDSPHQSP